LNVCLLPVAARGKADIDQRMLANLDL